MKYEPVYWRDTALVKLWSFTSEEAGSLIPVEWLIVIEIVELER